MYCFLIDYYLVYVYFLCQFVLIFFLILVVTNIYIYIRMKKITIKIRNS
jgi:pilus assembly protein TadC